MVIIAVVASFAIPGVRAATRAFTGDTNKFTLQIFFGGALGKIAFGGAFAAEIKERKSAPAFRALFTVFLFGFGIGASIDNVEFGGIGIGEPSQFTTSTNRKLEDFEGFGNATAVEVGFAPIPIAVGLGGLILPDGTSTGLSVGASVAFSRVQQLSQCLPIGCCS